jgi:VanZ family protein
VKIIKNYWEFNKLFVLLSFLWTFTILYLSLSSFEGVKVPIKVSNFDKLAHFLMYSIYAFLIVFSFKNVADKKFKFYFLIFLYLFIFGSLVEVLQGTVTKYRSQDVKDALANGFGAFVGLFFAYMLNRKFKKINKIIN